VLPRAWTPFPVSPQPPVPLTWPPEEPTLRGPPRDPRSCPKRKSSSSSYRLDATECFFLEFLGLHIAECSSLGGHRPIPPGQAICSQRRTQASPPTSSASCVSCRQNTPCQGAGRPPWTSPIPPQLCSFLWDGRVTGKDSSWPPEP
jgi:hypothetical protein